jgi:AraC-like DNA-binding protein
MLAVFQKVEANINHSFYVEHRNFQYFPNPLHFHPDIEILVVNQGTGTIFVGDSVSRFGPGDLIMIGQNVPHKWCSDEKYTQTNSTLTNDVIFILFKTDIFGEPFWNLPESKFILRLIQNSQRGIKLTGVTCKEVTAYMRDITDATGFERIRLLVSILSIISFRKEYLYLASPIVQNAINESDFERLNKVYDYVIENFPQEITLEKVASVASLTPASFCRYFKKRTNKTFVQFLNEIRIAHACQFLIDEEFSVSKICYSCGFNNISFFIKQFKRITGSTPLQYKKYHFV